MTDVDPSSSSSGDEPTSADSSSSGGLQLDVLRSWIANGAPAN